LETTSSCESNLHLNIRILVSTKPLAMKNFYYLIISIALFSISAPMNAQVEVSGCTDDTACNYNPLATIEDGSCIFDVDCLGICGGNWFEDKLGDCVNPDGPNNLVELNCTGYPVFLTVPDGNTSVAISAYGAEGGGNGDADAIGGLGAFMSGEFDVNPGDVLRIHVGCVGHTGVGELAGGGGGGGSFVVMDATNEPLIIAGGGGGAGHLEEDLNDGDGGRITELGGEGWYTQAPVTMGGLTDDGCGGGTGAGGGGWAGEGQSNNWAYGGAAAGGPGGIADSYFNAGGYGGGGGGYHAGGGGGGYTGGSGGGVYTGCTNTGGGGGGSFNSGTNQEMEAGNNAGDGLVSVEFLGMPESVGQYELRGINVYPNPAINNLTIDLSAIQGDQVMMQVFDATGKLVQSTGLANTRHDLNVSNWADGVYQLVFSQAGVNKTIRLMVD
jgi:hypothetical protein